MSGKEVGFMIFAFLIGMIMVVVLSPRTQPQQNGTVANQPANVAQVAQQPTNLPLSVPGYLPPLLIPLAHNHFLYVTPNERFFVCKYTPETGLEVVEVYQLSYKPDRYLTELSKRKMHGWYFDASTVEKEAVIKAKLEKFKEELKSEKCEPAEEAAKDLVTAGGVSVLLESLRSEKYNERRAAALALAELGYVETVPVLAELLREKRSTRERVTPLLVKLTGKNFVSETHGEDMEPAVKKYLEWWKENQK